MLVADYLIEKLGYQTDYVFQVYGSATASLIDAFTRFQNPKLICTQHEQGAGFMMEGYTKVTGKIGVGIATSGPGGMNFVTPIGNMFYDSVPGLFITGQVHSRFMRPNKELRQRGFQETDIVSIVNPITKYAKLVTNPEDIKYELEKAIHLAYEGRPGPVLLDIPLDVQKEEINEKELIGYTIFNKQYSEKDINRFISLYLKDLKNSQRPIMLIGGGVSRYNIDILTKVSKRLGIPLYPTYNALDVVCSDNENYCGRIGTYGGAGRNFGLQNCDLLLAIGSRISGRIIGGQLESWARDAKKYLVNIDSSSLDKKYQEVPFDENLLCDSKTFLSELDNLSNNYFLTNQFSKWKEKCLEWRYQYSPVRPEHYEKKGTVHPYAFLRHLSSLMNKEDIIVVDCGGNLVSINHSFETKSGQVYITNNGNSPMGGSLCYGIGAELGRKIVNRCGKVVIVIGDGGMMMNIQELQTMLSYDIKPKIIILNNNIYGITKGFQKSNFNSRHIACGGENKEDYHPCDFNKVVEAFGLKIDQHKNNQLNYKTIEEFLNNDIDILNVDCENFCEYLPKIANWKDPLEMQYPYLSRDEFLENMIVKPVRIPEK